MADCFLNCLLVPNAGLAEAILIITSKDEKNSGALSIPGPARASGNEYDPAPALNNLLRRFPNLTHPLTSGFVRFNITLLS